MAALSHGCPGPVAEPLLTCLGSGLPTSPLAHRVPRDSIVNLTHPQELATPEPLAARSKPHPTFTCSPEVGGRMSPRGQGLVLTEKGGSLVRLTNMCRKKPGKKFYIWHKCLKHFACHAGLVEIECNERAEINGSSPTHHSQQEECVLVSKTARDVGLIKRKGLYRADVLPTSRGRPWLRLATACLSVGSVSARCLHCMEGAVGGAGSVPFLWLL